MIWEREKCILSRSGQVTEMKSEGSDIWNISIASSGLGSVRCLLSLPSGIYINPLKVFQEFQYYLQIATLKMCYKARNIFQLSVIFHSYKGLGWKKVRSSWIILTVNSTIVLKLSYRYQRGNFPVIPTWTPTSVTERQIWLACLQPLN